MYEMCIVRGITSYLLSAMVSAYVALIMKTVTSARAIRRCSRVHGCPSARRHADYREVSRAKLTLTKDSDSATWYPSIDQKWNTPLGRSQWQSVGHVGGPWSESSVPGRCHCLGEPHLADRQSPMSAEMVRNAQCSEAPHHRPSPSSNKVKREAYLNKTHHSGWMVERYFTPMILWRKLQDTHVGLHCEFKPKIQRRLTVWISGVNMLGHDWVGQDREI